MRLPAPGETDLTASTVVQPDLVVVCDPAKLDEQGCKGAPDLVVEILSPDDSMMEMTQKLRDYFSIALIGFQGGDTKADKIPPCSTSST